MLGRERRAEVPVGRVIFRASAAAIARLDVRRGPCVGAGRSASGGRLSSLWSQHADPIETVEALFRAISGDADPPWDATTVDDPGTLYTVRPELVDALANLLQMASDPDPDHPRSAPYREAAARWRSATAWPRDLPIDALVARLIADAAEAAAAQRSRIGLYCWSGPLVLDGVEDGRTGAQILQMRGEY
jgi:hypothetical protein